MFHVKQNVYVFTDDDCFLKGTTYFSREKWCRWKYFLYTDNDLNKCCN